MFDDYDDTFDDYDDKFDFYHNYDEDRHFGCDECEICADCPHLNYCDGCGNYTAKSPAARSTKKQTSTLPKQPTPEAPEKTHPKKWTQAAIGLGVVAFIVIFYVIFLLL